MIKKMEKMNLQKAKQSAIKMIKESGLVLTREELENIDAVDFGLNDFDQIGLQIVTLFNTDRISARILVMLPNQVEPEHWHVPVGDDPGKQEIIRGITGNVYFYIDGDDNINNEAVLKGKEAFYTMRHEVVIKPGDQIVLEPGSKHWFRTDDCGAVMYCFATCSRDNTDQFSDPNVVR